MRNIVLIGFMGTGKSVVGRLLAKRLRRPFVDLDHKIEQMAGMPIREIFSLYGEKHFRALEFDIVRRVSRCTHMVVATGGGVILNPVNIILLRRRGILFRLTAPPDVIVQRTAHSTNRPLLNNTDPAQAISELLQRRETLYRRSSDYVINTIDCTPQQVVDQIIQCLRKGGHKFG